MVSGIRNVSVLDTFRALVGGYVPPSAGGAARVTTVSFTGGAASSSPPSTGDEPGGATTSDTSSGSASGTAAIGEAARKYLGVPYVWGGKTAKGLDCSGLVYRAIVDATGDTSCPTYSWTQATWKGFDVIGRAAVAAGDVVWWPGHIAVAVSNTQCIAAPRPGLRVRQEAIRTAGPIPGEPARCLRYNGKTRTRPQAKAATVQA